MERRLVTILAADVVGYSRLMERDEAGTYVRLRAARKELFEPEIARRHGHMFKLMGDGMLAEFASVVNALECAVALQARLKQRGTSAAPDDLIQELAVAGGVSGRVAKEVEKKRCASGSGKPCAIDCVTPGLLGPDVHAAVQRAKRRRQHVDRSCYPESDRGSDPGS